MIDGGHLRVLAKRAGHLYNPDYIEKVAHSCLDQKQETLLRILYYDCAPYMGQARLPVSGEMKQFAGSDAWLRDLGRRDLFAIREGVLKFRGFKPRRIPISLAALSDDDFKPDFEQKGVDMRIGLDIATYSDERLTDRIILVTGDSDCIPAMKHGRKSGIQVILIVLAGHHPAPELFEHADYKRTIPWPV
jgi:uncharacterized LabA/DUF88 family protein